MGRYVCVKCQKFNFDRVIATFISLLAVIHAVANLTIIALNSSIRKNQRSPFKISAKYLYVVGASYIPGN